MNRQEWAVLLAFFAIVRRVSDMSMLSTNVIGLSPNVIHKFG